MIENKPYLKEQIITYLGNKRSLLGLIEKGILQVKKDLKKNKLSCGDLFSGSGIVSRFLKAHCDFLIANDLELYSKITNSCYLYNINEKFYQELCLIHKKLLDDINLNFKSGFITRLYSPLDENNIKKNDRVFYTKKNAMFLDTARKLINDIPENFQNFFIAPLLYEASNRANTSGVFKGFYKNKDGIGQFGGQGQNALKRIKGDMELKMPIFSNFHCEYEIRQEDTNSLALNLDKLDCVYLDPPYNQHPYGSNYFMLNLISNYIEPLEISKTSGIVKDWNRSVYNKKKYSSEAFFDLISSLKSKFVLISFNSEGFISKREFIKNLEKFGTITVLEKKYNAFRASRNLKNRNLHLSEFLYILKKGKKC